MTAKERILAIRLSEKIRKNPGYAVKIGVKSEIKELPKQLKECS